MNVQEIPIILPPYHAGAAKRRLITLLKEGHEGVRLGEEALPASRIQIEDQAARDSLTERGKAQDKHVLP